MGIDIPNIHLIIHYGISKDLESYYQEIGRGGRDNNEVKCYVYWSKKDFVTNRYFIRDIENEKKKRLELSRILSVEKYIYTGECRMNYLVRYLGEDTDKKCGKCDKYGRCLVKLYDSNEYIKSFNNILVEEGYAYKYYGGKKMDNFIDYFRININI